MHHYNNSGSHSLERSVQTIFFLPLRLFLIFGLLFSFQAAQAQSGWVRKKNETFSQVTFSGYGSEKYYNLNEEKVTTSRFSQYNLYLYSEYGITDRLTVIANFPLLRAHGFSSTETVWGIGDLRIDAKYGFLQQKLPISVSVGVEAPTAKPNRYATNEDGFGSINLPTGDGEWNFHTTVAFSGSLHPLPAYFNLSGSFNKRTSFEGQNFQDQYMVNGQFGYQFFHKLWLQASLGILQTIGEPEGIVSFVRGDGTAFTQYGLNASYQISEIWGVGLQYYNNADFIVQRKNVYASPTFGISLFYQKQFRKQQ